MPAPAAAIGRGKGEGFAAFFLFQKYYRHVEKAP